MDFLMMLAGLLTSSSLPSPSRNAHEDRTVVVFDGAITEVTAAGLLRTFT